LFTATLIAADRLDAAAVSRAAEALRAPEPRWIEPGRACDLVLADAEGAEERLRQALPKTDIIVQPAATRRKRLLVADMDSTMITVECIDELADYAGLKAQVAAVTEAAMRGELDFEAALDARVALLAGMDAAEIDRCRAERVRPTPGAIELVRTMRADGATCLLVSGGFTRFAEPVADAIGFDRAHANVLIIEDGRLTGTVRRPIVGAEAKKEVLLAAAAELGVGLEWAMAVGDGANDIPMLEAAGFGVAYRAKPAARAAADARIDHNDLSALLYAQGYPRSAWISA
jgi:phosphoserine phosphatase